MVLIKPPPSSPLQPVQQLLSVPGILNIFTPFFAVFGPPSAVPSIKIYQVICHTIQPSMLLSSRSPVTTGFSIVV
jgi:hypothetical protein